MAEKITKGDLVKLTFEGKTDGVPFEKTEPGKPVLVAVGEGQIIIGLDEAVAAAGVGETKTVTIAPEKAFGARNPELVRLVPLDAFKQSGVNPVPGTQVELDGMPARVQSISGGRVRVDFNNPLAGKTLEYTFKVEAKYSDAASKLNAMAEYYIKDCTAKLEGDKATITVPASVRKDGNFVLSKARFIDMAFGNGVAKKITVNEDYEPQAKKA